MNLKELICIRAVFLPLLQYGNYLDRFRKSFTVHLTLHFEHDAPHAQQVDWDKVKRWAKRNKKEETVGTIYWAATADFTLQVLLQPLFIHYYLILRKPSGSWIVVAILHIRGKKKGRGERRGERNEEGSEWFNPVFCQWGSKAEIMTLCGHGGFSIGRKSCNLQWRAL